MAESLRESSNYSFATPPSIPYDFAAFKAKRDAEVARLNTIYDSNWSREGIALVHGTARFTSSHTIAVALSDVSGEAHFTAPHICIATGGNPVVPADVEGAEEGITNEGFFEMSSVPKKIAVVGAGYIAVEMAGMLNAIGGCEVHLFIRGDTVLRSFDPMVSETMTRRYEEAGIVVHKNYGGIEKIERISEEGGEKRLKVWVKGEGEMEFGELLWAVGRSAETKSLDLKIAGVKLGPKGHIEVDTFQNTSVEGVYALGDVTGQLELTPGKFCPAV